MKQARDVLETPWWVVIEHPTMGEAKVLCEWKQISSGQYVVVPRAVEFDVFTPPDEQDRMLEDLKDFLTRLHREVDGIRLTRPTPAPGSPKRT